MRINSHHFPHETTWKVVTYMDARLEPYRTLVSFLGEALGPDYEVVLHDLTSEEGTTMMAKEFGPIPFKSAKTPENVFFAQANDYTANGNYVVTWAFNYTPAVDDWRAAVVDALTQYSSGNADWSVVKTAFVDGWAAQYAKENS